MEAGHFLTLFVTVEQENAIRSVFSEKGWTLVEADISSNQQGDSKLHTDIYGYIDDKVTTAEHTNEMSSLYDGDTDCVDSPRSENGLDTDEELMKTSNGTISLDDTSSKCTYIEDQINDLERQTCETNDKLQSLISRGKLLCLRNVKQKLTSLSEQANMVKKSHSKFSRSRTSTCKRYICKKKPIHCEDCKMTFTSQVRYDKHKERNGGQCVFQCEYCSKVFLYRKSRYDLHIRSAHSKERPFTCDVCGKGYVTSDKLKIHKRLHTGEKPCVCEECGKTFYSRGDLAVHRDYHHTPKEGEVQCNICSLTFCSKRYLIYHQKVTHSSVRDFHCSKCSKSFKCNSSLKRHLKYIHSQSKEFQCETCNKSFKTSGSLKKHSVRHSGERTYFCNECNKGFYEKFKLLQHYRTHTGEKPYQCDMCDYKCALSGNLNKHKKTHYKELTNAVL